MSHNHDTYPGNQNVNVTREGVVPGPEHVTAFPEIPTQEVPPREGGHARLPLENPAAAAKEKEGKGLGMRVAIGAGVLAGLAAIGGAIGYSRSESAGASGPVATSSAEATPTTTTSSTIETQPANVEVDPNTLLMKVGDVECNGVDSCAKIFEVSAHDKADYKAGFVGIVNAIETYENPANGPSVHNAAGEAAFKAAFVEALVDPSSTQQAGIISVAEQNRRYNQEHGTTSAYTNINTDFSSLGDLKTGLGTTATMTHTFLKDDQPLTWSAKNINVTYGIKTPTDANKYDLTLWQSQEVNN